MSTPPDKPRLPVRTSADLLAVVPHLLGFTPRSSLVVIGTKLPSGRVQLAMRYDLPDPPDGDLAADIADHARSVVTRQHLTSLALVGYGPGPSVTPVVDAIRAAATTAGLTLHEALRVEEGRTGPTCAQTRRAARPAASRSTRRRTRPAGSWHAAAWPHCLTARRWPPLLPR
jgi:hypothetical protein